MSRFEASDVPPVVFVARDHTSRMLEIADETPYWPMPDGPLDLDNWDHVQMLLVRRVCDIAQSAVVLTDNRSFADAAILVRVALDHAIAHAWLGIKPERHIKVWVQQDYDQRMKTIRQRRALGTEYELPQDVEADFRSYIRRNKGKLPQDPGQLCKQIDTHYAQLRMPEFLSPDSKPEPVFGLMYAHAYRDGSDYAHASPLGLDHLTVLVANVDTGTSTLGIAAERRAADGSKVEHVVQYLPQILWRTLRLAERTRSRPVPWSVERLEQAGKEYLMARRALLGQSPPS